MDRELSEKLQQIAELMEGAKTPGEAEAASAAFQRVLMRHNLDEATARASMGKSPNDVIMDTVIFGAPRKPGNTWKSMFYNVLAKFNFCHFILVTGAPGKGFIVGEPQNIAATISLFEITTEAFARLADQSFKRAKRQGTTPYNRLRYTNGFLIGASQGLYTKMEQQRKKDVQEFEGAGALVLVKEEAVARFIENQFSNGLTENNVKNYSHQAYNEGFKAGYEYESARPLEAPVHEPMLGG